MQTGRITNVNVEKGYYFVRQDRGGADLFGHATELRNASMAEIASGMRVQYETMFDDRRGKERAIAVSVID